MVPSRIYFDQGLQRYADTYIETPYAQIQGRTLSLADRAALPGLIDPYGRLYLEDRYRISIAIPLCSRLQAIRWAQQFGVVHVWKVGERITAHVEGHCAVWAHTFEDACMLAGIQVLREHSIRCLDTREQTVN